MQRLISTLQEWTDECTERLKELFTLSDLNNDDIVNQDDLKNIKEDTLQR